MQNRPGLLRTNLSQYEIIQIQVLAISLLGSCYPRNKFRRRFHAYSTCEQAALTTGFSPTIQFGVLAYRNKVGPSACVHFRSYISWMCSIWVINLKLVCDECPKRHPKNVPLYFYIINNYTGALIHNQLSASSFRS